MEELSGECLSSIFSHLPATDVIHASAVCKSWHSASHEEGSWRQALQDDFPYYYNQLIDRADTTRLLYRSTHRHRHQKEQNWRSAQPSQPHFDLLGHTGNVFDVISLTHPFTSNLALSCGQLTFSDDVGNVPAEIIAWDLNIELERGGRLGWHLNEKNTDPSNILLRTTLAMVQIPGSSLVGVTQANGMCNILDIQPVYYPSNNDVAAEGAASRLQKREALLSNSTIGRHLGKQESGLSKADESILQNIIDQDTCSGYEFHNVFELKGHTASMAGIFYEGGTLATASFDGSIKLWRPPFLSSNSTTSSSRDNGDGLLVERSSNGQQKDNSGTENAPPTTVEPLLSLEDQDGPDDGSPNSKATINLVLNLESNRLVSAGNDMQVKLWDVERKQVLTRMEGHEGWIWGLRHLEEEGCPLNILASGATDGTVRIWDTRVGQQTASASISQQTNSNVVFPVSALGIRADKRWLVAPSLTDRVYMLDVRTMRFSPALPGTLNQPTRVNVVGDTLLCGCIGGEVGVWEL